ncbi:MAG: hypothetical protein ACJ78Q_00550 [Chloroflexia bacterium]
MADVPLLPGNSATRPEAGRDGVEQAVLGTMLVGILLFGLGLYALAVWFDWLPWLRGWRQYPEGWTWRTYPVPPMERFEPVVLAVIGIWSAVLLAELGHSAPWQHNRSTGNGVVVALYLVVMIVLGYALQMGLLGLKAANAQQLLVERETNRVFSGYFNLAASTNDASTFFSRYPAVFDTKICPHCHDHPPGPGLYYWLNIRAAELLPADWRNTAANWTWDLLGTETSMAQLRPSLTDAQILGALSGGTLLLLLSAAVVVPLFGLARLLGPPGSEFRLAALGLALPGLMLMAPEFDQLLATIAAAAVLFGLRGLLARDPAVAGLWGLAAGIAVALGLFFSWGLAALLVVIGCLGAAAWFFSRSVLVPQESERPRLAAVELLPWGGGIVAGVIVPLAALQFGARLDLAYVFQYNLRNAALAEANRPYDVWLLYGPLDFVQFLGLPLAVATLFALVPKPWRGRLRGPGREDLIWHEHGAERPMPWYAGLNVYAVALILLLLILDLAGRSKAEQGRLFIFLMPLALASFYLWTGRRRPRSSVITLLFFTQMLVCIVIGARWFVP